MVSMSRWMAITAVLLSGALAAGCADSMPSLPKIGDLNHVVLRDDGILMPQVGKDSNDRLYPDTRPVCQILPPNFPGHEPFCLYTKDPGSEWSAPDMEKARALVEESGTKGQKVTVISEDTVVSRDVGTYLASVLSDLGYEATVKAISANIQFTYIQNTNNNVQISVSQWYQDYPAASNFLNVLLSCASFHPGSDASVNISGFCDKEIDGQMQAVMKQAITDPEGANVEWAKIDRAMMEKAPLVPLFTPKNVDFLSTRVGNYMFSSQYKWVISQAWVQ